MTNNLKRAEKLWYFITNELLLVANGISNDSYISFINLYIISPFFSDLLRAASIRHHSYLIATYLVIHNEKKEGALFISTTPA